MSPRDQLNLREVQVATMVWEGKTNPEIAAVLGSTERGKEPVAGNLRQIRGLEPAGIGALCGWARWSAVGGRAVSDTDWPHGIANAWRAPASTSISPEESASRSSVAGGRVSPRTDE